ncbi:MAG: nitrilase-related carbon-nitrogen hydrolase [Oscillospiraceae bacterium]
MQDGFLRAAAASIPVAVADPRRNAAAICARIDQAHRAHAALLALPELCVTGYTCGDLFLSALLLDAAETALTGICAHTQNCDPVVVLGVPLRAGGKLYNCAAVLHRGRILGVVPKTWLPNYDVFAEKRCFTSAAAYSGPGCVTIGGEEVPFGAGLVFGCAQMPAFRLGVELCEDVWAPVPPSVRLCLAGATVIANCSASPEAAGKPAHRRTLLRAASARGLCGYVYANAGPDESTERAVFPRTTIAENGSPAEHAPFAPEPGLLVTELDLLTLGRAPPNDLVPDGRRARRRFMPLPTLLARGVAASVRAGRCRAAFKRAGSC